MSIYGPRVQFSHRNNLSTKVVKNVQFLHSIKLKWEQFFNKSSKESNLMIDDPEIQDIFILFFQNMGLTIIVVLY